jgi:hypothetical protein
MSNDSIDYIAKKSLSGYIPPYFVEHDFNQEDLISVLSTEFAANNSNLESRASFLYVLVCSNKKVKRLSTYIKTKDGKVGTSDEESDWSYVPPDSSGMTLIKILCPK